MPKPPAEWSDTCDRAEPEPTVPPLHLWDLRGQLTDTERAHLTDIEVQGDLL